MIFPAVHKIPGTTQGYLSYTGSANAAITRHGLTTRLNSKKCPANSHFVESTSRAALRCQGRSFWEKNYTTKLNPLKGQGGHFQTHSEGHFQAQSSLESIFTARDIIWAPRSRGSFPNTRDVSFSNTKTQQVGHFQTQAYFLTAGTAFSRRSQGFLSHENYAKTSQPCRITAGGTGVWPVLGRAPRKSFSNTQGSISNTGMARTAISRRSQGFDL